MRAIFKISAILLFVFLPLANYCIAEELFPFLGEVNNNDINIRSDSTVSAQTICLVNKGARLEVLSELYGWYKIRLPKTAPSFIKKSLTTPIDEKTAKLIANRVNIRLSADESSPILGMADKDQTVNILEDKGSWYKIEPINNSFGYINKKFIVKVTVVEEKAEKSTGKASFGLKNKRNKN